MMEKKQRKILNENYEKIGQIGEGSGGKVYLCKNLKDSKYVVVKKFIQLNEQQKKLTQQEVNYMQKFDHPNVIKALDVFSQKKSYGNTENQYICMDFLIDIKDIKGKQLSINELRCIGKQLLIGLQHLHEQNVIHRDIKPSNMFLNNDGIAILGDFGLMRQIEEDKEKNMTGNVVTRLYRPPEIFYGEKKYNSSLDIWSLGVTIAELFVEWGSDVKQQDQYLFNGQSEIDTLAKIFAVRGSPNEQNWPGCSNLPIFMEFEHQEPKDLSTVIPKLSKEGADILQKMMSLDPKQRPSAKDCLNHPFFKDAPEIENTNLKQVIQEYYDQKLKKYEQK